MDISKQVGSQIRRYRQANHMTLEQLAQIIHKGKSTLSKYETGEIVLDVEMLVELASALNVTPGELLRQSPAEESHPQSPGIFSHRVYLYFYDGRVKRVSRSVLEHYTTGEPDRMRAVLFYDVPSFEDVGKCRGLYIGHMTQYAFITNYTFENQRSRTEQVFLYCIDRLELLPIRTGVLSGLSFRTMTPVSVKVLVAEEPQRETEAFVESLMLSREDLRLTRKYNMLTLDNV